MNVSARQLWIAMGVTGLLTVWWLADRRSETNDAHETASVVSDAETAQIDELSSLPGPIGGGGVSGGYVQTLRQNRTAASVAGAKGALHEGGAVGGAEANLHGGAVGAPNVAVNANGAAAPALPVIEKAPEAKGCYEATYAARKDAKVAPRRLARAELKLEGLDLKRLAAKSLCLRVDGVPVKFEYEAKANVVKLGALRRDDARVSVSYCLGEDRCGISCVVPKDEFMEAIAGTADADDVAATGWAGASKDGDDAALEKEIAGMGAILQSDRLPAAFAAWKLEKTAEPCLGAVAKTN